MYTHTPKDYICPICLGIQGVESKDTLLKGSDLIYKDKSTSVFVNSFFIGKNEGHLIVVPNQHYENIYDIPPEVINNIMATVQKMTLLMKKAYKCEGITLLQNNEPVGGQHAFHFHLHIFPRYKDDDIYTYMTKKKLTTPEERKNYTDLLKKYL